ncbi:uncharacterized protein LOC115627828 isoform X2 [Scaptodrosophila lebanonensis]|uniref:Uncharacterized protein LOC115627828 isoform X2 n=1 Tax=Drosophila lebanonensis TaxID=7225 RepID=A0A6J2TVB5_DROLE|nr:uncharacterized protein LOC115627828 isoform X2 [Scaptodrosophila lebanonensis]
MSKRTRDAEEGKKKQAAKARFKKLVRGVVLNRQWLSDPEDVGISLNAKKNVALLVRQKHQVGMLTISKVRARLVPVVKFQALGVDRVIMKEGDIPITIYFILTGEIEMKKQVFQKSTKSSDHVVEAIFGPGDCIGDVEMLERCPRRNTYTTLTQCELLVVYDNDYRKILEPFMKKQWEDKKTALAAVDYFDFLNKEQIINACKFGTLMQYEPLQTIYYEDKGSVSYVHFILSGECVILQCLNLMSVTRNGKKAFYLTDLPRDGSKMFESEASKTSLRSHTGVDLNALLASSSEDNVTSKKAPMRRMGLRDIEIACGHIVPERKEPLRGARKRTKGREKRVPRTFHQYFEGGEDTDYWDDYDDDYDDDGELDEHEEVEKSSQERKSSLIKSRSKGTIVSIKPAGSSEEMEIFTATSAGHSKATILSSILVKDCVKKTRETHFIDVGSLTYGGVFGLGERMEHRVIMARTTVQCLLLPRFWLLEKAQNPGNIWQRRRFYFECNVPSREALFENFLKTRKWDSFKEEFIVETLGAKSNRTGTKMEDIPIMCRIVETSDDDQLNSPHIKRIKFDSPKFL